jgi:hypothetical protein
MKKKEKEMNDISEEACLLLAIDFSKPKTNLPNFT